MRPLSRRNSKGLTFRLSLLLSRQAKQLLRYLDWLKGISHHINKCSHNDNKVSSTLKDLYWIKCMKWICFKHFNVTVWEKWGECCLTWHSELGHSEPCWAATAAPLNSAPLQDKHSKLHMNHICAEGVSTTIKICSNATFSQICITQQCGLYHASALRSCPLVQ